MRKPPENRRAALAWYPRPLSGEHPRRRKLKPQDEPNPEVVRIRTELEALRGEGKIEFEAEVHGHPVTVRVEVVYDTDTDPKEWTNIEWVHGENTERERIGYVHRGSKHNGFRPTIRAKIIRARRGHHPDRHAYEACDVSDYMEEWLRDARKAGMSRHAAWEWAKACALGEYEELERFNDNDWCYVGVTVKVISEVGAYEAKVAEDSLWGIAYDPYEEGSDEHLRLEAFGCVQHALTLARRDTQSGLLPGLVPTAA